MIPESKLKADCTPEIIKRMSELAEGFEPSIDMCFKVHGKIDCYTDSMIFALLIHRAVEELEYVVNQDKEKLWILLNNNDFKIYPFNNYQPESLTHCECACLHCLIEVLK